MSISMAIFSILLVMCAMTKYYIQYSSMMIIQIWLNGIMTSANVIVTMSMINGVNVNDMYIIY